MIDTARALYQFFSGFGVPAYAKNNVPDTINIDGVEMPLEPPYITYEVKRPEPLSKCLIHAWVWYRGTAMTDVLTKCDEIEAAIGTGLTIRTPGGFVALYRDVDTPFAQEQPDPDKTIRVMYLTMILHANTT